jgi:excisionase family DNA binding protein
MPGACLTLKEVSQRLGLSLGTVRAFVERGELAAVNLAAGKKNRRWRVSEQALEEFIARRTNAAATPKPVAQRRHKPYVPQTIDRDGNLL